MQSAFTIPQSEMLFVTPARIERATYSPARKRRDPQNVIGSQKKLAGRFGT
ncbi:MAG: hypothetical protein WEF53_10275 [Bacteroidota bacterium]